MKIALAGFAQDTLVVKGVQSGLHDLDLKEGKGRPREEGDSLVGKALRKGTCLGTGTTFSADACISVLKIKTRSFNRQKKDHLSYLGLVLFLVFSNSGMILLRCPGSYSQ